jgi:hypothetical protein
VRIANVHPRIRKPNPRILAPSKASRYILSRCWACSCVSCSAANVESNPSL